MPGIDALLADLRFEDTGIEIFNGPVETYLAAHSEDRAYRVTAKVTTEGRPLERFIRIALSDMAMQPPRLMARTSVPLRWLMSPGERVDETLLKAQRAGQLVRALSTTRNPAPTAPD